MLRNERALSTVVATIFFVVIFTIIFVISFLSAANMQASMAKYDLEVFNEKLAVTKARAFADDFVVYVKSEGNEEVRLVAVWFLRDDDQRRLELITRFLSPKGGATLTKSDLKAGQPAITFENYETVKVVTQRGNIAVAPLPFPVPMDTPNVFPLMLTDIVATPHPSASLQFNATNTLTEPLSVTDVFVDLIDPTGARKGALYEYPIVIEVGKTVHFSIQDLTSPSYGASLRPNEGDRLIIELFTEYGQVVGHVVTAVTSSV